jgi:hypothetical protein
MIYAGATARRLALLRIALFGLWLIDLALDPIDEVAALPVAWFAPHGPYVLLPRAVLASLWDARVFLGLKLAALGSVVLALIGTARPRLCALLACALLTLVLGFVRGFGHADHSQLQLLFATYLLAFLPAWDALCVGAAAKPAADGRYAASFAALALVFGFPYLATAVYRLTHEGWAIFAGHTMQHFIARDTLMLDHFDFTLGLALLEQPALGPLLNAGFAGVTVAELAAPFVYLRPRWAAVWLAVMVPFHVIAPVIMHTLFAHNLVLLFVLYAWPLTWDAWDGGRRARV